MTVREFRTPMRPPSRFTSLQAVIDVLLTNPSTCADPFLIGQFERFVQDYSDRDRFVACLKVYSNEQGTIEIRIERLSVFDELLFQHKIIQANIAST